MKAQRPRRLSTPSILWPNGAPSPRTQPLLCKWEEGRGEMKPPQTYHTVATSFRDKGTTRGSAKL